jgi:hypothetical protein
MIIEIIRGSLTDLSMLDTAERIAAAGALLVNLSGLTAVRWLESRATRPQPEAVPKLKDAA